MGFPQAVSWFLTLCNVIVARIYSYVSWPFGFKRIKRPVRLWVGMAVFALLVGFSIADTFGNIGNVDPLKFEEQVLGGFRNLRNTAWTNGAWSHLPPYLFIDAVMIVGNVLSLTLAGMLALSIFVCAINWVFSFWFGRLPVLYGSIIQVAVETTPPGDWSVIHSTWQGGGQAKKRLLSRHSEGYSDPKVIAQIVGWLKAAISSTSPGSR